MCTYICRNAYKDRHAHTYVFKSNAEEAKLIPYITGAGSFGVTIQNRVVLQ